MREIMPAQGQVLTKIKTLETGLVKSREMEAGRKQYRLDTGRNPTVIWEHPKDGKIQVEVDDKLIRAIQGATNGAYRGLKADGYPDIAKSIVERNK